MVHTADILLCDPAETDALVAALESDADCGGHPLRFPRGTLLPDGRLDLCKQSLGAEGGRRISTALRSNTRVRSLLLGTNALGDEGVASVARMAQDHPAIETLYLGCNRIRAAGTASLCEAVETNPRIRSLWLKRNPLGDDGVALLAEMLSRTSALQVLDLVNCGMTDRGLRTLLDGVARNRSLTHLYLGANGLQPAAGQLIAECLRANTGLQHLFLDTNLLGDEGAEALAGIPLASLSLASNGVREEGVRALCRALPPSLSLGLTRAGKVMGCPGNEFGDSGASLLAAALPQSSVCHLKLGGNALTRTGFTALLDAAEQSPSLARLDLPGTGMPPWLRSRLRALQSRLVAARPERPPTSPFEIRSVYR